MKILIWPKSGRSAGSCAQQRSISTASSSLCTPMSMEGRKKGFWLLRTFCTISAGGWPMVSIGPPTPTPHPPPTLTFGAQVHALDVEGAVAQGDLLHDDAEAVDIGLLHARGGQLPLLQQLRGCPQLLWRDTATGW